MAEADGIRKDAMDSDDWFYNFIAQLESLGLSEIGLSLADLVNLKAGYNDWADSTDAEIMRRGFQFHEHQT